MRYYRVDDLSAADTAALHQRLAAMDLGGSVDGVYWLPVAESMLSAVQREHLPLCGPYAMALELEENFLQLEFLVRARGKLRCECVHYASPALRAHVLDYMDTLLTDLGISA